MASDEESATSGNSTEKKMTKDNEPKSESTETKCQDNFAVDVVCVFRLQTGEGSEPIDNIPLDDTKLLTEAIDAVKTCTSVHLAIAEFSLAVERFRKADPSAKAMMSGFFGIQDWIEL